MRKIAFDVKPNHNGRTVLSLLKNELKLSGTLIKRLKRTGGILLCSQPVFVTQRVCSGDVLEIMIPQSEQVGTAPTFPILYEDEDLLIINKPACMLSHATKQNFEEITVAGEVRSYLCSNSFHPVNRLDRGTSGAMVIAKSGYIHNILKDMLHTASFYREYTAVLCGHLDKKIGNIEIPIARDEVSPIKRVLSPNGKYALTSYEIVSETDLFSLAKIVVHTGRTHQIRLHMASLGTPLAGDFLYGNEDKKLISRPALHSCKIRLIHPTANKLIEVFAPLPDDMKKLISI